MKISVHLHEILKGKKKHVNKANGSIILQQYGFFLQHIF